MLHSMCKEGPDSSTQRNFELKHMEINIKEESAEYDNSDVKFTISKQEDIDVEYKVEIIPGLHIKTCQEEPSLLCEDHAGCEEQTNFSSLDRKFGVKNSAKISNASDTSEIFTCYCNKVQTSLNTCTSSNMNELRNIIDKQLTFNDRLEIKKLGPPRPDLSIQRTYHTKNRSYNRQFNRNIYDKCDWICGCSDRNAFFCFPCVLFGIRDVWTTIGVSDLKHLDDKIKKHTACKYHLLNEMNLAMLGQVEIRQQLDDGYRLKIKKQHEQVDKNRYILSTLIDCIKFCGTHELALRDRDEYKESENPGTFRGLVDFVASLDVAVRDHINSSNVFKGISKTIQNDILDAILEVSRTHIKKEIEKTDYLSIQVDEISDVSCISQMGIIFRYQIEGEIYERFWGFFKLKDRSADGITDCIMRELENVGVDREPSKLIGQSYDGSPVFRNVESKIREKYPAANVIHCYVHQGNLILQQATSSSKQVRIFFSDIEGIGPFFDQSQKRTDILTEVVKERMPQSVPIRWNFKYHVVNIVHKYKDSLIECFERICETFHDKRTISLASGFIRLLQDGNFLFFLDFFHSLMPHVDILFNQIQKKNTDSTQVLNFTTNFIAAVMKVCDSSLPNEEEPIAKRKCFDRDIPRGISNNRCALEVCETIINVAKSRFAFTEHLSAARLFVPENFEQFNISFPDKDFEVTVEAFKDIQKSKLKTELEVLYSREDLRNASGATSLLQFLIKNNLKTVFSESVKLLKIVVTLPMTTVDNERCFSTLKDVKTFLRNTMGQERLNALAMMSVSRHLLNSIPDFKKQVTDIFAGLKNRTMEFNYM